MARYRNYQQGIYHDQSNGQGHAYQSDVMVGRTRGRKRGGGCKRLGRREMTLLWLAGGLMMITTFTATTTFTTDLVSEVAEGQWLIEGQPVLDTIPKGLKAGLGIQVELVNALVIQPSFKLIFEGLGEVPVVQGHKGCDTFGEDIVDHVIVEVDTLLVHGQVTYA